MESDKNSNTKKNEEVKKGYTKDDIPFADGKDSKLDKQIDKTISINERR